MGNKPFNLETFRQDLEKNMNLPNGKSYQQIRSTLNQLVKAGIVSAANFEQIFEDEYKLTRKYHEHLRRKGNRDFSSATSNLRRLLKEFRGSQSFDHIQDFNELMRKLVSRKYGPIKTKESPHGKITLTEISRNILDFFANKNLPLPSSTKEYLGEKSDKNARAQSFSNWLKSTKPAANLWKEHLLALDDFLDVPKGTLLSRLEPPKNNPLTGTRPTHKRRKTQSLPPNVSEQFSEFSLLKMEGAKIKTVNFHPQMKGKFSEYQIIDTTKRKTGWSRSPDGDCKTQIPPLNGLRGYFTFLANDSDRREFFSESYNNLDLSYVADHELLSDYISYLQKNKYATLPALNLLRLIEEISRDNGYLRLGVLPMNNMSVENWFLHLDELLRYIPNLKSALKKNAPIPKDNKKAVRFLIEMDIDSAYQYLDTMIELALENCIDSQEICNDKNLQRQIVSIILLLSRCAPLRINNWTQLKLNTFNPNYNHIDFPSLLIEKNVSAFRIFVPKRFLKNRNREDISDINMPIPTQFNWLISNYLEYRGSLLSFTKTHSDHLFLKLKKASDIEMEWVAASYTGSDLGIIFKKITKELIGRISPDMDHPGIHPHAMRHLAATMFLNDNPDNFVALSTLLNDSLKVVIDTYAEIDTDKQSNKISNWAATHYKGSPKGR